MKSIGFSHSSGSGSGSGSSKSSNKLFEQCLSEALGLHHPRYLSPGSTSILQCDKRSFLSPRNPRQLKCALASRSCSAGASQCGFRTGLAPPDRHVATGSTSPVEKERLPRYLGPHRHRQEVSFVLRRTVSRRDEQTARSETTNFPVANEVCGMDVTRPGPWSLPPSPQDRVDALVRPYCYF